MNGQYPQPDVTLLLDMDGVIREASVSSAIVGESVEAWLGRSWVDTVEEGGGDKIKRMVADARASGIAAFRQITQRFPGGLELPMEYTIVLLGGRAGLLAVGKNLQAVAELQTRLIAAQQALERDYWKLREIETRYRMLFDASHEAVLLVRVSNLRIVEANPAAMQALGLSARTHVEAAGRDVMASVTPEDRNALQSMFLRIQEDGKAPGMIVHLGQDAQAWIVRGSLMTAESGPVFMLQLTPAATQALFPSSASQQAIEPFLDRMPDAFVMIDQGGVIAHVNQAFLDLIEVGAKGAAIGQRLSRWLTRPGADLAALLGHVQRNKLVRLFSSTIHGELGTETDVEISAAGDNDTAPEHIGLLIRNVEPRIPHAHDSDALRAMIGPLSDQIGKTPLRKLVKDTVAVVERHYVKAAIERAHGNRTAAAEMLGLSRQSLYAKLDRYSLDGQSESNMGEAD